MIHGGHFIIIELNLLFVSHHLKITSLDLDVPKSKWRHWFHKCTIIAFLEHLSLIIK